MGGIVFGGVSAQEIQAACFLLRVPESDLPDVSDNVSIMAAVAANINNEAEGSRRK